MSEPALPIPVAWWMTVASIAFLCAVLFIGLRKASFESANEWNPEDPTRINVLKIYIVAAMVLGPGYTAFFVFFGAWYTAIGPAYFGISTFIAFALHKKGLYRHAALTLVFTLWTAPAWCAVFSGKLDSPLVIWLAPSAFIAAPLLGRFAAAYTGSASVFFVVILGLMPEDFPCAAEMQASFAHLLLGIACGTTAIALLAFYGFSASSSYEQSKIEMAKQNLELAEYSNQLDHGNMAMKRILDNVAQGFLTLSANGQIGGRWSSIVETWFGAPYEGQSLWTFFEKHDENVAAGFKLGFDELESGWMPEELTLEQMPKRLTLRDRELKIDLRSLAAGEFLVVLTDITDALSREAAESKQKSVLAILRQVKNDQGGVRSFLKETSSLVEQLKKTTEKHSKHDFEIINRNIHTVKGNAGMFGLSSISHLCHELEDSIAETGEMNENIRIQLEENWQLLLQETSVFINDDEHIQLSHDDLEQLEFLIKAGASQNDLIKLVHSFSIDPIHIPLSRLAKQAERLANQLGKKVDVRIKSCELRTAEAPLSHFWAHYYT